MEMNLEDPFTRAIFAVISGAIFSFDLYKTVYYYGDWSQFRGPLQIHSFVSHERESRTRNFSNSRRVNRPWPLDLKEKIDNCGLMHLIFSFFVPTIFRVFLAWMESAEGKGSLENRWEQITFITGHFKWGQLALWPCWCPVTKRFPLREETIWNCSKTRSHLIYKVQSNYEQ